MTQSCTATNGKAADVYPFNPSPLFSDDASREIRRQFEAEVDRLRRDLAKRKIEELAGKLERRMDRPTAENGWAITLEGFLEYPDRALNLVLIDGRTVQLIRGEPSEDPLEVLAYLMPAKAYSELASARGECLMFAAAQAPKFGDLRLHDRHPGSEPLKWDPNAIREAPQALVDSVLIDGRTVEVIRGWVGQDLRCLAWVIPYAVHRQLVGCRDELGAFIARHHGVPA